MKNPTLPILLFAILFAFTACEKEPLDSQVSTEETEVISLAGIDEIILFHVSQLDLESGAQSGLIIDKEGIVKTYELSPHQTAELPESQTWTEDEMYSFYYKATTTVTEIGQEELISFFQKIKPAASGSLSNITNDDTQTVLQTFEVFDANTITSNSEGGNSCEEGCDMYETTNHKAYLLKMEGAQQQLNEHTDAEAITDWLKGLKIEAGL